VYNDLYFILFRPVFQVFEYTLTFCNVNSVIAISLFVCFIHVSYAPLFIIAWLIHHYSSFRLNWSCMLQSFFISCTEWYDKLCILAFHKFLTFKKQELIHLCTTLVEMMKQFVENYSTWFPLPFCVCFVSFKLGRSSVHGKLTAAYQANNLNTSIAIYVVCQINSSQLLVTSTFTYSCQKRCDFLWDVTQMQLNFLWS